MHGVSGIFAVNKPSGPTSTDIVSKLKMHFSASSVFESQIKLQQSRMKPKQRHLKKNQFVKIGHGGTLDPLASGVLVIGIGDGTKQLGDYLGKCTKTYRATALFGTSTTTYDSEGSVVRRCSTQHLSNDRVLSVLDKFRGSIKQTPPVFSALKMDGKRLHEYARSGEKLPREIEPRECQIDKFDVVGELTWDHAYSHPKLEANDQEKEFAAVLNKMHLEQEDGDKEREEKEQQDTAQEEENGKSGEAKDPTLEIEFTVSSGTYIRSLIHDLGLELGTAAHMVKLTRLAQGNWELDKNVFEVGDFLNRPDSEWEGEIKHYLQNGPETELSKLRHSSKEEPTEQGDTKEKEEVESSAKDGNI